MSARRNSETVDAAVLGRPAAVLADTRWPEAAEVVLAHAREIGCPGVLDAEAPVPARLVELASHVAFSVQGLREFTDSDLLDGFERMLLAQRNCRAGFRPFAAALVHPACISVDRR